MKNKPQVTSPSPNMSALTGKPTVTLPTPKITDTSLDPSHFPVKEPNNPFTPGYNPNLDEDSIPYADYRYPGDADYDSRIHCEHCGKPGGH